MSAERPPLEIVTEADPLDPSPLFLEACASFGIELEADERTQLGRFLALLLANQARMNLTAITDPEDAWSRHIFDALTLLSVLHDLPDGSRVADLGSGGGVPALPLAIVLPRLRFTLVETTKKKALYLREVASALGLEHVEVVDARAETVGRDAAHRGRYRAVTARAVGALRLLVELGVPLLEVGGRCAFIKGERAPHELEEAKRALGLLQARHEDTLETPTGRIVVLSKVQATPRKYPRRSGEPKRDPL